MAERDGDILQAVHEGIGKAHGIRKLREVLSMAIAEMVLAGDAVLLAAIDRRNDLGTPDRFDVYCGMADNRIGVTRLDLPEHLLLLSAPAAGGEPTTGGQE